MVTVLAGCGGGGRSGDQHPAAIPEPQFQNLMDLSESVGQQIRDSQEGTKSLEEVAAYAQSQAGVREVQVSSTDSSLTVLTREGINVVYLPDYDYAQQQSYALPVLARSASPTVGRGVILCPIAEDPGFPRSAEHVSDLQNVLQRLGYPPQPILGRSVNVECMRSLYQYGLVFFLGHGGISSIYDGTWNIRQVILLTGEEVDFQSVQLHRTDLIAGRLVITQMAWGSDRRGKKWVYAVTPKFFRDNYSRSHFPNSLFYSASCSGLGNVTLADALTDVGVGAYLGWSEPTRTSPEAGIVLLTLLYNQTSLSTAYGELEKSGLAVEEERYDPSQRRSYSSRLAYYPDSARNFTLSGTQSNYPRITIQSPEDQFATSSRLIRIQGQISGSRVEDWQYSLSCNDWSRPLQFRTDGLVNEDVLLQAGQNTITLTAAGLNGSSTKSVCGVGQFAPADVQIELTWTTAQTDLDLHLIRPGSKFWDYLGDCTWSNTNPDWGSAGNSQDNPNLIREDSDGHGPEYCYLEKAAEPGRYTIKVHYFDDNGVPSPTYAEVRVKAGGRSCTFGPAPLTRGYEDVWYVADILAPEGRIIPVNRMETKSGLGRAMRVKK